MVHRWLKDNIGVTPHFALPSQNGHKNPSFTRYGFLLLPKKGWEQPFFPGHIWSK
jgi:hypothetical protein